ncbi:MAG: SIMPL domain-containing protein [Oligoflexia bacterium]|nr:SIMPL domain-containing protein [Oligoflexia bacterium]
MRRQRIGSLTISAALVLSSFVVRDAVLSFRRLGNTIEVRGLDERVVKSDQANWQIKYVVTGASVADLYSAASSMSSAVVDFLSSKGFAREEIQKTPLSITDRNAESYNSNKQGPRFTGRGSILLSTKKVDQVVAASEATDALVASGVVLEGAELNYFFTGLNAIKPDMLKAASQSATAAAQSLARDTGVKLGRIKQVSQGLFTINSPFNDNDYDSNSSLNKLVRVVTRAEYSMD